MSDNNKINELCLIDINGKVLWTEENLITEEITIQINLQKGTYFLQAKSSDEILINRFTGI